VIPEFPPPSVIAKPPLAVVAGRVARVGLGHAGRGHVGERGRDWRRIAASYSRDRVLIGEIWLPDHERLARYLRPDELHSVFNFDFLCCAWEAPALREVIGTTLDSHARVGAQQP
jgi:hypothetical protein